MRPDRLAPLLAAILSATPLVAQDIRPADVERWEDGEFILGRALWGALQNGNRGAVAVLVEAMRGGPGRLEPEGDWNCRTLKLGDVTPLVAYGNFKCTITKSDDGVWQLDKTTGSQRSKGTIQITEAGAIYTGVGFVGDAPSAAYAELSPEDNTPRSTDDQTVPVVGWFVQMDENRARLMQPDPILESDFDILYLTRE